MRPPDNSLQRRIARARARLRGGQPQGKTPYRRPPTPKRRVPRREIEARRQRMVRWGVGIAAAVVVAVLVGGVLWDQVIKPNQTVASVNGQGISRQDYWKYRANNLYEQALQYQDFAQFVGPDQQGQYQAIAQQSLAQIPQVWGSTDLDPATLERMIEDKIYLQGLADVGQSITPEEISTYALNRFAPPDAPLLTPVPTPTLTAARAAIATSTAAAFAATPIEATAVAGTPGATPLAATPVAATLLATPIAEVPPATPDAASALATAEAGFTQFQDQFFPIAHLSRADYERLVAAPALARQKAQNALQANVGQSAPQVHAAHILLPTREAADAARARIVDGGEDFATVARELSTDTATAPNGGDLGWFTRAEMVPPFAEAAFTLKPGEISEPVETEYGWHLIRVDETDPDRPLTDRQLSQVRQDVVNQWLQEERDSAAISSSLAPTPTPIAERFTPPVDAPPPPAPTPLPAATPLGSPVPVVIATPAG
ncbi:MAG: peptidylprolyl isomerase [Thermomicrobiales bacterium]